MSRHQHEAPVCQLRDLVCCSSPPSTHAIELRQQNRMFDHTVLGEERLELDPSVSCHSAPGRSILTG
jgi:hypothetical protein